MKILLTGSSGFFAKKFIKHTSLNKKIKLICITRKKNKIKHVKYWQLDLSKKTIRNYPKKKKFDLVIHSSFIRMKKNHDPQIIFDNFNITKNLIQILKKNYFKKIINISSSSLYQNKDGKFSENNDIYFSKNNDKTYGLSKYFAEMMFNSYLDKKKIIHLRVGNIIGNDKDKSIVSEMKRTLKNRNCIEIYGNGKRVINLIHVRSLIQYIFLIFKKNTYGIFNISDYSINLKKLAKLIKNKYGSTKSKLFYRKKKYVKNPRFNIVTSKFFNLIKKKKPGDKDLFYEI